MAEKRGPRAASVLLVDLLSLATEPGAALLLRLGRAQSPDPDNPSILESFWCCMLINPGALGVEAGGAEILSHL